MAPTSPIMVRKYDSQYPKEFEYPSEFFGIECEHVGRRQSSPLSKDKIQLCYGLSFCAPIFIRTRNGLNKALHAQPLGLIQGEHESVLEELRTQTARAIYIQGTQTSLGNREIQIIERYGIVTEKVIEVDTGQRHWETLYHPIRNIILVDRRIAKELLEFAGFEETGS